MVDFRICLVLHRVHTDTRLGVLILGGHRGWVGEAREQFIYIVGLDSCGVGVIVGLYVQNEHGGKRKECTFEIEMCF